MAFDEALLEAALADGVGTVRWYRWSRPTVSLGYFQQFAAVPEAYQSAGLDVVRRLSGGGAILHDRELTYSLSLPPLHSHSANPHELYVAVHAEIAQVLSRFGFTAAPRGSAGSAEPSPPGDEAFLCFGRGDPCDLLLSGWKILGSAQRRRRGAVLQHGSLLLEASPHAANHPGLFELAPRAVDLESLAAALAEALRVLFSAAPIEPGALDGVVHGARALERARYGSPAWNQRL